MKKGEEVAAGGTETLYLEVTLKSGSVVRTPVKEFTLTRDPLSGDMRELAWTPRANASRKLRYLNMNEVAAVVAVWKATDDE